MNHSQKTLQLLHLRPLQGQSPKTTTTHKNNTLNVPRNYDTSKLPPLLSGTHWKKRDRRDPLFIGDGAAHGRRVQLIDIHFIQHNNYVLLSTWGPLHYVSICKAKPSLSYWATSVFGKLRKENSGDQGQPQKQQFWSHTSLWDCLNSPTPSYKDLF